MITTLLNPILIHKDYNPNTITNDVAALILARPLVYNSATAKLIHVVFSQHLIHQLEQSGGNFLCL